MNEYFILGVENGEIDSEINKLGVPFTKIKEKMTYYLVQAPGEKLKGLYEKGAKLLLSTPDIPKSLDDFTKTCTDSLDDILIRENLPAVNAIRYVPMHSACSPISREELTRRDSFLGKVYNGLVLVKKAYNPSKA